MSLLKQHLTIWFVLKISVGLLLLALLLFPFGFHPVRSIGLVLDIGHFAVFAAMSAIFTLTAKKFASLTLKRLLFWGFILPGTLGLFIELIQIPIPSRGFGLNDAIMNVSGCLFSAALFAFREKFIAKRSVVTLITVSLIAGYSTVHSRVYDSIQMAGQFPVLSSVTHQSESTRWRGIFNFDCEYSESRCYIQHQVQNRGYSGVILKDLIRDWRGYRAIEFELWVLNDGSLTIRIDDFKHRESLEFSDRFNRHVRLTAGWNTLEIPMSEIIKAPKERELNIADIYAIQVFSAEPHDSKEFKIGRIALKQ